MSQFLPETLDLEIEVSDNQLRFWQQLFGQHHDIWQDHDALTQSTQLSDHEFAAHFDSLRRIYPNRFEYDRYRLTGVPNKKAAAIARELFFCLR